VKFVTLIVGMRFIVAKLMVVHEENVLIAATLIEEILKELNIKHLFYKIYGSPTTKKRRYKFRVKSLNIRSDRAIMFGYSNSGYMAERHNNVMFFLRRTELNKDLQSIC